jgi:hypothetical protein
MEKMNILNDFEEKFKNLQRELKFKSSLNEIDGIFFVKDLILKDNFVSSNLGRQLCYRIAEVYMGWNEYLHGLIMPSPQNILNLSESKIFNQEEKKGIMNIIKKIMELNSRNILITLTKDSLDEGKFIDYSVNLWKNEVGPEVTKIIKKVNKEWGNEK